MCVCPSWFAGSSWGHLQRSKSVSGVGRTCRLRNIWHVGWLLQPQPVLCGQGRPSHSSIQLNESCRHCQIGLHSRGHRRRHCRCWHQLNPTGPCGRFTHCVSVQKGFLGGNMRFNPQLEPAFQASRHALLSRSDTGVAALSCCLWLTQLIGFALTQQVRNCAKVGTWLAGWLAGLGWLREGCYLIECGSTKQVASGA